jgi:hypothetical protein
MGQSSSEGEGGAEAHGEGQKSYRDSEKEASHVYLPFGRVLPAVAGVRSNRESFKPLTAPLGPEAVRLGARWSLSAD